MFTHLNNRTCRFFKKATHRWSIPFLVRQELKLPFINSPTQTKSELVGFSFTCFCLRRLCRKPSYCCLFLQFLISHERMEAFNAEAIIYSDLVISHYEEYKFPTANFLLSLERSATSQLQVRPSWINDEHVNVNQCDTNLL